MFLCKLAANAEKVLRGEVDRAYCRDLKTVEEVRVYPRPLDGGAGGAKSEYKFWTVSQFERLLSPRTVQIGGAIASSGG